ncbi:hypothetical protein [Chitinophaga caseinilytica]|uniref:Uncharacterized protein n=1 Tax=Chitinophaga caseinilytica TaxID=2267521 RepID=A0ABZ2Z360_9BACT
MSTQLRNITLACLFFAGCLLMANNAAAQTKISTPAGLFKNGGNYLQGTSTDNGSTLFCTGSSTFTLASTTTDPENNLPYTNYTWEEMNTDGTTYQPMTAGSAPNKANVTNASPGWHIYRVSATIGAATGCEADPTYFTVYVLPPLKVTPRVNKTDAEGVSYCSENGAPTGPNAFTFTSVVAFDATPRTITGTQLPALTIDDFELQYTWSKVDGSSVKTTVGNADSYTLTAAANPGHAETYSIALDVNYAAKTACTYTAPALYSGTSTTNVVVKEYKKAGKPTITIE